MYMYMYEETNDNRRKAGPWRPPARRKEDILASAKSATGGPKARRFKLNLGHRQRGACDDDSARSLASGAMGRPPSRLWVFGLVNKAWGWLSWHHHRYGTAAGRRCAEAAVTSDVTSEHYVQIVHAVSVVYHWGATWRKRTCSRWWRSLPAHLSLSVAGEFGLAAQRACVTGTSARPCKICPSSHCSGRSIIAARPRTPRRPRSHATVNMLHSPSRAPRRTPAVSSLHGVAKPATGLLPLSHVPPRRIARRCSITLLVPQEHGRRPSKWRRGRVGPVLPRGAPQARSRRRRA